MSTPRFEPGLNPDLIAVGPVYEPMCCPWHTDTCGLEDWCCDACSEAGLVVATRTGRRVSPIARPTTSFPKDEA